MARSDSKRSTARSLDCKTIWKRASCSSARGIIARDLAVTEEHAATMLRVHGQRTGRPLRQVAEAIVTTSGVKRPQARGRPPRRSDMTQRHRKSQGTITRKRFLLSLAALPVPALNAEPAAPDQVRVLLVVAHPDDEYAFAATTYRLAKELGAAVDQVVITNGEAGFRYSQLAESYYGVALTHEETGRSRLPEIRKKETLAAGRILGIRKHYFLGQKDARFTLDASEAARIWDIETVSQFLVNVMRNGQYHFVFVLLPTADTHGHHRAAALIALEAARQLPAETRPVVLGGEPAHAGEALRAFHGDGVARVKEGAPVFVFDRRRRFGRDDSLSYQIIVHWMMAEHKSQGLFQTEQHDEERYWVFAASGENAAASTQALFARVGGHAL
jgi:LmbE family N-acetylglucosaminyl deacetylase